MAVIFSHAESVCYVDMTHPHKAFVVLGYKHSHKICQRRSVNNIIAVGLPERRRGLQLCAYPITTNKSILCNLYESCAIFMK